MHAGRVKKQVKESSIDNMERPTAFPLTQNYASRYNYGSYPPTIMLGIHEK
jgi:hypothetical protein